MSSPQHVVVDGSNIATEGRSMPSLHQLDEAVQAFAAEYPDAEITVVVDATFGHRIDAKERPIFDDAVANGEIVSPPAGAIGRGDAFVLRIADKVNATVLSNDSFQEFHGEHEWLFTPGRLIGGKPVPAVGWIFTLRTPVRGIKSREATRDARRRKAPASKKVVDAIQVATREVQEPSSDGDPNKRRRRRRGAAGPPSDPVNDPLPFITFIADHTLGSEVEGLVESFSSHGAFIDVDGAKCYVPLSALGDPPPRAARDVLNKGERRTFVVQAFDPMRRGIELALPGFAHVSGAPTAETVEAEIEAGELSKAELKAARKAAAEAAAERRAADERAARDAEPAATAAAVGVLDDMGAAAAVAAEEGSTAASKMASGRKAAAKRSAAPKRAARTVAAGPVDLVEAEPEAAPAEVVDAPTKKTAAKKAATKKTAPKKAAAVKRTPAAKKAAPAKKVAAEKSAAKKAAADKTPAKKAATRKAATKKAATKKAATKTVAKKAIAEKAPARKAAKKTAS